MTKTTFLLRQGEAMGGANLVKPLGDGWVLDAHFVGFGRRPMLSEIRVRSDREDDVPDRRLGTALRKIRPDHLERDAARRLEELWDTDATQRAMVTMAGFWGDPEGPAPKRTGRRGTGDLIYAKLARDYCERLAAGSRTPIKDLSSPGRARRYISEVIHEARRRDLLTAAPGRGKPGGSLTDKARKLLSLEC